MMLGPALAACAALLAVVAISVRTDGSLTLRLAVPGERARARPPTTWSWGPLEVIGRRLLLLRSFARVARIHRIERDLVMARLDVVVTPAGVVGAGAVAGTVIGGLAVVGPGPLPLLAPILGLAAAAAPSVLVSRAARHRVRAADSAIPQLLDLLSAGTAAGLPAMTVLARAARTVRGPLAEELASVLVAVDHGAPWRSELEAMAARLGLPDLRRVVATIGRSERLGSNLSRSLRDLAADVRAARRAGATERARAAPVKMLFPLVLLVLPAFLLLTVVSVLLVSLRSIG
jgi:pilus assembly protein TadC